MRKVPTLQSAFVLIHTQKYFTNLKPRHTFCLKTFLFMKEHEYVHMHVSMQIYLHKNIRFATIGLKLAKTLIRNLTHLKI